MRYGMLTVLEPARAITNQATVAGQLPKSKPTIVDLVAGGKSLLASTRHKDQRDMTDDFTPTCDKCGAPVTTGMMAAYCPYFRECEFYTPELEEWLGMDWQPPFPNQDLAAKLAADAAEKEKAG